MAFVSRNRKPVWRALAAIVLAGLSALACGTAAAPLVFPPAPAQCVWEGIERVVAVGDLHGDYDAFVKILQDSKLIDDDAKWIGGRAHLVQIGDVIDRGDRAREIYILMSRLEREAAAAGGQVHFLPGNHEEMNLARVAMDYVGYVSIEQFKSFLHGDYRAAHERRTSRMSDEDARRYWDALMPEAKDEYYNGFRDAVGPWIVGHNVVVKINGIVFVHGGINMENSRRSLEFINARYREEFILAMRDNSRSFQFIFQTTAPLWYRGLEEGGSNGITLSDAKQILANLKATNIVVGHTPTATDGTIRFGGLVYMIDSIISSYYAETAGSNYSQLSYLAIDEKGKINHIKGVIRHGQKKRPDGLGSFSRGSGDLFLRPRPASAPGQP
jgi:hypothetical protein